MYDYISILEEDTLSLIACIRSRSAHYESKRKWYVEPLGSVRHTPKQRDSEEQLQRSRSQARPISGTCYENERVRERV